MTHHVHTINQAAVTGVELLCPKQQRKGRTWLTFRLLSGVNLLGEVRGLPAYSWFESIPRPLGSTKSHDPCAVSDALLAWVWSFLDLRASKPPPNDIQASLFTPSDTYRKFTQGPFVYITKPRRKECVHHPVGVALKRLLNLRPVIACRWGSQM